MLKKIIKRNGVVEDLIPSKLNKWSQWAAHSLEGRVDWSSVVMEVARKSPEIISSQDLQLSLIKECVAQDTYPYNLMAGRLQAAYLHKKLYGDTIPTVYEMYNKLRSLDIAEPLFYSIDEFNQMQAMIDHNRDMDYSYFQIKHISSKYTLKDPKTNESLESPQFTFMRMAMALASEIKDDSRMQMLKDWYDAFSGNKINPPTPNYVNLGTHHRGYSSCCLYTVDDTAQSLAIGDHIAYTMTYMSAGIGSHINTRSIGDSVRNIGGMHKGKLAYYRAMAGAVHANLQGGRGGACTSYYSLFDPEAETITMLQNPRSTEDKKNRDIHFAVQTNTFLAKKAARNEEVFAFNIYSAPDLMAAFFSPDIQHFEDLYNKYEQDEGFVKKYTSARKLIAVYKKQTFEVGTLYHALMDEINRHTPFVEPIYSSNLCVAPETPILTKEYGYVPIEHLSGRAIHVWNGQEWSKTTPMKTGENQKIYSVIGDFGTKLECTPYHKFAIVQTDDNGVETIIEKRAHELSFGDRLIGYDLSAVDHGNLDPSTMTYNCIPHSGYAIKDRLTWFLTELYSLASDYSNQPNAFTTNDYFGLTLKDHSVPMSKHRKKDFIALKLMLQEMGIHTRVFNFAKKMTTTIAVRLSDFAKVVDMDEHGSLVEMLQFTHTPYAPLQLRDKYEMIVSVKDKGVISDTYCFKEEKRGMGMFNGTLTKQCLEILEPTAPYQKMVDLYTDDDVGYIAYTYKDQTGNNQTDTCKYNDKVKLADGSYTFAGSLKNGQSIVVNDNWIQNNIEIYEKKVPGEVALCTLGGIVEPNIKSDQEYERIAYLTLRMIDICIHKSHYELPHVGYTAKKRLNAAVGLVGAATSMARAGVYYSTKAGKQKIHEMAERHAYFCIKASLQLGKELGNAPWMHKTKWPAGWLPIDTYNKNVDSIVENKLHYDWQELRADIISNGGIRNSTVIAHMPTESSSKASGMPNGWYAIRGGVLKKSDGSNAIEWHAHDYDLLQYQYENAYGIPTMDMLEVYAVIQKFTDQATSADLYKDRILYPEISTSEMLKEYLHMVKLGVKTTYYQNNLTNKEDETLGLSAGCGSGGCTL